MSDNAKQVKRKLSEAYPADPPAYDAVGSPLSDVPDTKRRDEDLVSAAEALTRLTNAANSPAGDDLPATPRILSPLSTMSIHDVDQLHPLVQLVNTISKLPLVSNAVKYYEDSKRNYATFNYAAGIVEKAAMPVFTKIEVNLNSIHQAKLEERARLKKRRVEDPDKKETKKRIKFCLHILKLANDNISAKVNDLQQRIKESRDDGAISPTALPTCNLAVAAIKEESPDLAVQKSNVPAQAQETSTEIIATVKKIIHVISNFRPSSFNLSEPAGGTGDSRSEDVQLKSTIREIILNLPNQVSQSVASSQKGPNQAIKFATESLDMIGRLTLVFSEQLEKVENWVDGPVDDEATRVPLHTSIADGEPYMFEGSEKLDEQVAKKLKSNST